MGFSGIGIWEILVILIVALIVLGPHRLPEIARTLGKTLRAIRKASADLTTTVARELEAKEDKPAPPLPKGADRTKTGEAAAAATETNPGQHDPTKPGGTAAAK